MADSLAPRPHQHRMRLGPVAHAVDPRQQCTVADTRRTKDRALTDHEVIFDFETPGSEPPIALEAENPALHAAAEAWHAVMAGKPRKAVKVFAWRR